MKPPELVAHRGFAANYPENTLAAMRAAIECGARYIETDIQLSRDGVPMLLHDPDLGRMCGRTEAIHDLAAAELDKIAASYPERFGDTYKDEPVARLSALVQLLLQHPSVTAFIEIKRIALEHHGLMAILDTVMQELEPVHDRCVLISFDLPAMLAARRRDWPAVGVVIKQWKLRKQPIIRQIDPEYVFCDADGLPRLRRLSFGNSLLAVYEVDDPGKARRLARRGIDLIETFNVCGMLKVLGA